MNTNRPCDCPAAFAVGPHQVNAHEQDCGGEGGCTGCWGCTAETVAYHQVKDVAARGAA